MRQEVISVMLAAVVLSGTQFSCKAPARIYSATSLHENSSGTDLEVLQARVMDRNKIVEELGTFPILPRQGDITSISVKLEGAVIQTYIIGEFYPGIFSVYMLIRNEGDEEYEVPLNSIAINSADSNRRKSRKHPRNLPHTIVVDRCALHEWKAIAQGRPSGDSPESSDSKGSRLSEVARMVNRLFQDRTKFVLSLSGQDGDITHDESGDERAFLVGARECVRVLVLLDPQWIEFDSALLSVSLTRTYDMSSALGNIVFNIEQSMRAELPRY